MAPTNYPNMDRDLRVELLNHLKEDDSFTFETRLMLYRGVPAIRELHMTQDRERCRKQLDSGGYRWDHNPDKRFAAGKNRTLILVYGHPEVGVADIFEDDAAEDTDE